MSARAEYIPLSRADKRWCRKPDITPQGAHRMLAELITQQVGRFKECRKLNQPTEEFAEFFRPEGACDQCLRLIGMELSASQILNHLNNIPVSSVVQGDPAQGLQAAPQPASVSPLESATGTPL